ncbi:M1 family metallopeptidase [Marinicella meishanensis]|uniref:M1 family metallopeptidase n=1 Tax=Marinicella meishanensis TaxID=2873263 RepID=UPI001CBA7738|nr:M1 family metallopeptidase [Marinicella sp. NBU2979]
MRILILCCALLTGCAKPPQTTPSEPAQTKPVTTTVKPDPHSFANTHQVKSRHLELDLAVNFEEQILEGHAIIHYDVVDPDSRHLVLDTRDLKIKRVEAVNHSKQRKLSWRKGQSITGLGTELIIDLPVDQAPIKVVYESMPQASGLQWLNPDQTSGKQHPFMFSQSQAIHARSWIPLQDTPAVRLTYAATIRTDPALRAVLSADNNDQNSVDGVHQFTMEQAIPGYLIAIAVGDLTFQKISEHVTVYAEQEVLAAAAHEFAATEDMITATEALYGPYRWGQYDLLVLPPSFPFGGMENPKLSHITPTIIAGDRSLDSLIAHELAHSWSGNLVTNAVWHDAWLNEGFTTYLESRITEAVHGTDRMQMEGALSYQALLRAMQTMDDEQQKLVSQAPFADPDDHFTAVTYDKGRFFLEWLEQQVGREVFDRFLNGYFDQFAFQSIQTADFLAYLQTNLLTPHADQVNMTQIKDWIYAPGIPDYFTPPMTNKFTQIDRTVAAWLAGELSANDIETQAWSTQEWLHFLRALPAELSPAQLQNLDQTFAFTQRQNSEIAHDWLLICIRNQYQQAYPRLIEYLTHIGRVKLIKPLYEAMMAQTATHQLARQIYHQARSGYHNIATRQIDLIVGREADKPD